MMLSFSVLSLIVCLLHVSQHATAVTCPPLNPPLPLHGPLAGRPEISDAARSLQESVETTLQEGVLLDNLTTSFSVEFYSLEDKAPLFRYHFSAPGLANASIGVSEVDSDTIYRLGSISKVFTVYTFLASVGDASWNQPITKYVPELAQAARRTKDDSVLDKVRWGDVTVGSLASHVSGISRDPAPNGQADFLLRLLAGFPAVPAVGGEYCNGTEDAQFPCDRACKVNSQGIREVSTNPVLSVLHEPFGTASRCPGTEYADL
jgi:Beta-lactamase